MSAAGDVQTGPDLATDGFAVFRSLLPAGTVHQVRTEIADVYARHGWLAPGAEPGELRPDGRRRDGAPGWWRFAEDIQRLESFHRLAHHPALRSLMATVVGGPVLTHSRRHLTIVNPEFWVPPHQEYTYVQGAVDFFTAVVPFTPFGDSRLRVLRERGPRRIRPLRVLPTRGVEAVVDPAEDSWSELHLDVGDVVVVHSLTTRSFTENTSPLIRLAAQYRFQSRRLPVVKASLKPEHYPRLPDWKHITRGWRTRRWIVPPLFPRLTEYRMPAELQTWHEVLPPPVSAYLG